MELFWKKNKILLITLFLLIICVIASLIQYRVYFNGQVEGYNALMELVSKNPDAYPLKPKKPIIDDTYTLFSRIVVDETLRPIMFVMPFLVMLCGVYTFYSKLKSGFFKEECMRRSYKKNVLFNVLDSWKNVIIIPVFLITMFVGCYIVTGNFDIYRTNDFHGGTLINEQYLEILPTYCFIYGINLILVGLFFINITLILAKKNSNLFVTLVQSYLVFIVVNLFTEVLIGCGLENIFPVLIKYNICNSLSMIM